MYTIQHSSELYVSAKDFLATLTMEKVNSELMPMAFMTVPTRWKLKPIVEWPEKEHLFDSWILLFGFLPVDRHSIFFDAIEPEVGFSEKSTSFLNRLWNHQREVSETASGCKVTDTVEFEPRITFFGRIAKALYEMTFAHRHKVLRKEYGESS